MANSVEDAFSEYLKSFVNLDPKTVEKARESRDNLLENIADFSGDDFFFLCKDFNLHYGSFARKTKCRELNDIDLMIGLSAKGATYMSLDPWDNVRIYSSCDDDIQKECARSDGTLDSNKVIRNFIGKLECVREYSRADLKKSGEAVVLNLKSQPWSFDIVPCFHTETESDGRAYFLIPNGKGNWKKTDPTKDRDHVIKTNKEKDERVLELVRLLKKWNMVKKVKTLPSYLLETMLISYADSTTELDKYIDFRFKDALKYIAENIMSPVYDMKGIEGDINTISYADKAAIKQRALIDHKKAEEAWEFEKQDKIEEAINKWREIFGEDFPNYG